MKIKFLVIMLGLLLLPSTGFGTTTSDLTIDSTAEISMPGTDVIVVDIFLEVSENVVLSAEDQYYIVLPVPDLSIEVLQNKQSSLFGTAFIARDLSDVGWYVGKMSNNEDSLIDIYSRKPRDGIIRILFS